MSANPAEKATAETAGEAEEVVEKIDDFNCNFCDRKFKNLNVLRIHISRTHKTANRSNIPQIDSESSDIFEENYCKACEECPETSEDVNYHVMNYHEANAVIQKYGHEWVNQRKYCIRKDSPFEHLFPH